MGCLEGGYTPTAEQAYIQRLRHDLDIAIVKRSIELGGIAIEMIRVGRRSLKDMRSELDQAESRLDQQLGITDKSNDLAQFEPLIRKPEIVRGMD